MSGPEREPDAAGPGAVPERIQDAGSQPPQSLPVDSRVRYRTAANIESAGAVVASIKRVIEAGFGIIPLIGSGMSAGSGIPAGADYQAYLFYALTRVFPETAAATDAPEQPPVRPAAGEDTRRTDVAEAWDPSSLRWPPFREVPLYGDLQARKLQWSQRMLQRAVLGGPSSAAIWQAVGAAADWRTTLHFLSRVTFSEGGRDVVLKNPDDRIIDSFFVNLTDGKHPNTAHMLLAHLADALRIKVMLTTNFDSLIEQAFQRLDMPVVSFDVHHRVGLPDARFVRAQRSVVKIHGGRYGLRADFSLDKYPNAADTAQFIRYLAAFTHRDEAREAQRHVLVMGVSGEEVRTVSLICHALLHLGSTHPPASGADVPSGLQVFWLCHRKSDEKQVAKTFCSVLGELTAKDERAKTPAAQAELYGSALGRITIASTVDLSLFLLNLYQHVFMCLPPAGVPFSAVWPVPPPPLLPDTPGGSDAEDFQAQALVIVKAVGAAMSSGAGVPIYVLGDAAGHGVSSIAAAAFQQLYGTHHCIWLDLEEQFDRIDLIHLVLEAIARRLGHDDLLPAILSRRDVPAFASIPPTLDRELSRLLRHCKRPLVIFVNGRNAPGRPQPPMWPNEMHQECCEVLRWLSGKPGVAVVTLGWKGSLFQASVPPSCTPIPVGAKVRPSADELAQAVKRFNSAHDRHDVFQRFAFGLALFRHPCYRSVLHSWALIKAPERIADGVDNDIERFQQADRFLEWLRMEKVIRDDHGQGVFLDWSVRRALDALSNDGARAETHQGIADWYVKLYRTCGDVQAAFESIYHRLECLKCAQALGKQSDTGRRLKDSAPIEISTTLDLIAPTLLSSTRPLNSVRVLQQLLRQATDLLESGYEDQTGRLDRCRVKILDLARRHSLNVGNPAPRASTSDAAPTSSLVGTVPSGLSTPFDRENLDRVERLISETRQLTQTRRYESADAKLREAFAALGIGKNPKTLNESDQVRTLAREWMAQPFPTDLAGRRTRCALHLLRRAQVLALYESEAEPDRLSRVPILRGAERIYIYSTELMRQVEDVELLQLENGILRTSTGLILSGLGRHGEAQRRYSESYAYLSHVNGVPTRMHFATVDLRRAQSFLYQLVDERSSTPRPELLREDRRRRRHGHLYDAIASVERAAYKIHSATLSAHWYSWLYEVQMGVCCEIAEETKLMPEAFNRFARCRDRGTLGEWFLHAFENGLDLVEEDPVRLATYAWLAARLLANSKQIHLLAQDRDKVEMLQAQARERLKAALDDGAKYIGKVKEYVTYLQRKSLEA